MGGGQANGPWRFLQAYYVVNALALLTYLPVRLLRGHGPGEAQVPLPEGISRETEVIVSFVAFMGLKFYKSASLETFLSTCFLYGKLAVAFLAYLIDVRLCLWYLILFGVLMVALRSPTFEWGPAVQVLTPPTLRPYETASVKTPPILVFFFSPVRTGCTDLVPTFAGVAARYNCDAVRFGKVDVSRWPELAERYDIDVSTASVALPSFVLFEGGKPALRLPTKQHLEGSGPPKLNDSALITYFRLDERLAGTYAPAPASKKKD